MKLPHFKQSDSATEWASRHYSWVEWDTYDIDVELLNPILRQFRKLAETFPESTGRIEYIGTYFNKDKVKNPFGNSNNAIWNMAHATSRLIAFNPELFHSKEKVLEIAKMDEDVGWHPKGSTEASYYMCHEFGHVIHRNIKKIIDTTTDKVLSRILKDLYDLPYSGKDPRQKLLCEKSVPWRKLAGEISEYAQKSKEEAWAEGFAMIFLDGNRLRGRQVPCVVERMRNLFDQAEYYGVL